MSEEIKPKHIYNVSFDPSRKKKKLLRTSLLPEVVNLPKSVDILVPFQPWNQGDIGSCTAHGISASFRILFNKQYKTDFEPSRLFIYYREREIENSLNQEGAVIDDGIISTIQKGVCGEKFWSYDTTKENIVPPETAYGDALHYKINSWGKTEGITGIKQVLASGLPVIFGMLVYQSFESDEVSKTGLIPMPITNETCLGGHCMCITGYDDSKGTFKVLNSWGSGWGDKGFCYLPYAYASSNNCDEFLFIKTLNISKVKVKTEEVKKCC